MDEGLTNQVGTGRSLRERVRPKYRFLAICVIILASLLSAPVVRAEGNQDPLNPWSSLEWRGNANWQTVDVSSNGNVIVATTSDGGLYVSNDAGNSWRAIFDIGYIELLDAHVSSDGNHIAAFGGRIIAESDDAGYNWSSRWVNDTSGSIRCKVIYDCGTEGWIENFKYKFFEGVAFASGRIRVVGKPIYFTGGTQWNWVSAGVSDNRQIVIATAWQWTVPGPSKRLVLSTDSGETFRVISDQFERASLSADGSTIVGYSSNGRISVSRDLGLTWNSESSPGERRASFVSNYEGTKLFALGRKFARESSLLVSDDSGGSWSSISIPGLTEFLDVSCDASCHNVLVAAIDSSGVIRIVRSNNGGETWAQLDNLPGGINSTSRVSTNKDGTEIAISTYNEIHVLRNGIWNTAGLGSECDQKPIIEELTNKIMIFSCTGAHLSSNSGISWDPVALPEGRIMSVSYANGVLALATPTGIYTSNDFANSWQQKLSSLPDTPKSVIRYGKIALSSDGRVLAITQTGPQVLISRDSGSTWSVLANFSEVLSPQGTSTSYGVWLNGDGSQAIVSRNSGGVSWLYSPLPVVVGSAVVGSSLSVDSGSWDSGVTLTYQWLRNSVPIAGKVSSVYVVSAADLGSSISVKVVGSRTGFQAVEKTSVARMVEAGTLSSTPLPVVVGSAVVGSSLSVNAGSWDSGVTLTYQWLRNSVPIAGKVSSVYVVSAADLGSSISVKVVGSRTGFQAVEKTSVARMVEAGTLSSTPLPVVVGSAVVGSSLSVNAGSWDSGVTLTYQWLRNSVPIAGKVSSVYVVSAADLGRFISVKVQASKLGYTTVTQISSSQSCSPMVLKNQTRPKVLGTAKVGATLKASTAAWARGVKISYRWTLDGKPIMGATKDKLKLLPSHRKKLLRVEVSQTCMGCKTAKQLSLPIRVL